MPTDDGRRRGARAMDDWDDLDEDLDHDDWEDDEWVDDADPRGGDERLWFADDDLTDDDLDGEEDDATDQSEAGWGPTGGAAAGVAGPAAERAHVSAWDVGAAAGIAGWLLDQQADRIAAAVRSAPAAAGDGLAGPPSRVPPPSGTPVDWGAAPLALGDRLARSPLVVTIAACLAGGRPLVLEARAGAGVGHREGVDPRALRLTVVVADLTPEAPVWVMFEEDPAGFRTAWLQPVFADPGPAGRAYRYTGDAVEAVDAVEWGLAQHGLALGDVVWQAGR